MHINRREFLFWIDIHATKYVGEEIRLYKNYSIYVGRNRNDD